MGLGKLSVLAVAMTLIGVEAHAVMACELKRAPRATSNDGADEDARKPARPAEAGRVRIERRQPVYHSPTPSRRIILQ